MEAARSTAAERGAVLATGEGERRAAEECREWADSDRFSVSDSTDVSRGFFWAARPAALIRSSNTSSEP